MIIHAGLAPSTAREGSLPTHAGSGKPPCGADIGSRRDIVYGQPTYWAVLKKRFGRITSEDFRNCGHAFFAICSDEYGAWNMECYRDWKHGIDTRENAQHKRLRPEDLYRVPLASVFEDSSSILSRMDPVSPPDHYRHSFAQLYWDKDRPEALWFYAQSGGLTFETNGPLCSILEQELFPRKFSLRWTVRLGPGEWSTEWYGR